MAGGSKKKNNKQKKEDNLPFVSICTPTFNRRPFIPIIIKCFESQLYPKDKLEWIIIDDGTDKIEDLVKDIPQVKYFKYDEKMTLGKKRNIMHEKSSGEIIVYMDDDDYYPPNRVIHAVEKLRKNPKALCAGSSAMYLYFKHIHKMYQFGPYGPNHSTAATFAFKRELLNITRYDDEACLAEEKNFLKNYTVPFVQLDPMCTILVFSHIHNSVDKKMLLTDDNTSIKVIDLKVEHMIKDPEIRKFFMEDIDGLLENYDPGRPDLYKQDVNRQIEELKRTRELAAEEHRRKYEQEQMMNNPQLRQIYEMREVIDKLANENNLLKEKIKYFEEKTMPTLMEKIRYLTNELNSKTT